MKYVVIKVDDIEKYCSEESKEALTALNLEIWTGKIENHKALDNKYLVINQDETYFPEIKSIIEKHEGENIEFD
jgi:hypothetical protein